LAVVGEAVANLNTAVVGLDAVERGHEKPPSLNVSWNPQDRVAAARKARRFVVEAVLVSVAEALSEFVTVNSKLPRYAKSVDRESDKRSRADKLTDLTVAVLNAEDYLAVGAALLIHWRNRVVHPHSRAVLTPKQDKLLRLAGAEIENKFSSLSVERLLKDFETGKPTLKDVSTLIAMSIRWARSINASVNVLSAVDLAILFEHYGLDDRILQIEAQTTPEKRYSSVVRMLQTQAPGLVQAYKYLNPPP
jgi:hypothetical protein